MKTACEFFILQHYLTISVIVTPQKFHTMLNVIWYIIIIIAKFLVHLLQ